MLNQNNCFQRGRRTKPVAAAVPEQKPSLLKNIHCVIQTPREKFLLKQKGYGDYIRAQQATICHKSLAKDHRMKAGPYTVCSGERAQEKEASFKQLISSGSWGNNRQRYHSSSRYTDRNRKQRYDSYSGVRSRGCKATSTQFRY